MNKKEKLIQVATVALSLILCGFLVFNAVEGVNIDINVKCNGLSPTVAADAAVTPETTQAQTVAPAETTTQTQTAATTEMQSETATQTQTAAPTEIQSETETQAQSEVQTTVQTPADDTTAPAETTVAQSGEMSTEEIVSLYNKAVNRVKPEASQITRNYSHVSIPEDSIELPSAIQGIAKSAIGTFVKPDDTVQEWTTADDFKLGFPVGGEDYSSHLTADMVESATCKDNGSAYEVEIILKDDAITSPAKGEGYAGVFNTTTASTFEDISIPTVTFNEVNINGVDGSIKCTIDKASERVTAITFSNTDIMYLNVKVAFSTMEAKMNMVQESNFTIEY